MVVALQIVGAALTVSAGRLPLTPAEITPYLSASGPAVRAGMVAALLALTVLVPFFAGLRQVISRADARDAGFALVAFGLGLVGIAVSYVGTALATSATLFAEEGRPSEIVAMMFETGSEMLILAGVPLSAAIAISAFTLRRSSVLSTPLALIGWSAAGLEMISAAASLTLDPSSRVAIGGLGVAALIVWLAATSLALIVRASDLRHAGGDRAAVSRVGT